MCKNYTKFFAINIGQTFKDIKDYYTFDDGFAKYVEKIEDTVAKVKLVKSNLLKNNTIMTFGELAMGKCGMYKKEIDEWNNCLAMKKLGKNSRKPLPKQKLAKAQDEKG